MASQESSPGTLARVARPFAARPLLCAFGAFLLAQFLLLGAFGSLTSGYHFIDDHEIVSINHDLAAGGSLLTATGEWAARDLDIRFRPLYYPHRVVEAAVFGENFLWWSIYHGLLVACTAFLLCCFIRWAGFSWPAALLFPALALVGKQGEIAWRLGPSEAPGLLLFAGALAAQAAGLRAAGRKSLGLAILSVALAAGASLFKESFILALPALAFLGVWMARRREGCPGWPPALRSQAAWVTALGVIGAVELVIILTCVGTTRIGYAGVDSTSLAWARLWMPLGGPDGFLRNESAWVVGLGLLLAWGASARQLRAPLAAGESLAKELAAPLVLAVLLVAPQVLLYAKSGKLVARYMVPGTLGCAFLAAWLLDYLSARGRLVARVLLVLLLLSLALSLRREIRALRDFAIDGRATGGFLSRIEAETRPDSLILVAADRVDNYEQSASLRAYLDKHSGRRNIHVQVLSETPDSAATRFPFLLVSDIEGFYGGRTLKGIADKRRIDCIAVLPRAEQRFLEEGRAWFDASRYTRWAYTWRERPGLKEDLVVFVRKPAPGAASGQ